MHCQITHSKSPKQISHTNHSHKSLTQITHRYVLMINVLMITNMQTAELEQLRGSKHNKCGEHMHISAFWIFCKYITKPRPKCEAVSSYGIGIEFCKSDLCCSCRWHFGFARTFHATCVQICRLHNTPSLQKELDSFCIPRQLQHT